MSLNRISTIENLPESPLFGDVLNHIMNIQYSDRPDALSSYILFIKMLVRSNFGSVKCGDNVYGVNVYSTIPKLLSARFRGILGCGIRIFFY